MTMSKMDLLNKARLEGMYYAYAKIKDDGIDKFAEELQFRSLRGVQLVNTKKDVRKFEQEIIDRVQDVVLVFALSVLSDEFDFSTEEMNRFQDRFALKASCIADRYLTWDEQLQILKDEHGMAVEFRNKKGKKE